jgi:hypothetical protein
MADLKNIFKKFETGKHGRIEKLKDFTAEIPEGGFESAPEKKTEISREFEVVKPIGEIAGEETAAGFAIGQGVAQKQKEQEKQIENILAKNMEEAYLGMSPIRQTEFKREGEKTAREINSLLAKTKVKVNKIINLIKKWLSLIPGVNKFFLEQESKIKADEILKTRR